MGADAGASLAPAAPELPSLEWDAKGTGELGQMLPHSRAVEHPCGLRQALAPRIAGAVLICPHPNRVPPLQCSVP